MKPSSYFASFTDQQLVSKVMESVGQMKWAEAACILRSIYLIDRSRWFALQETFLMQMGGQVEKAITLIRASSSSSPSMYYSYIPGLKTMITRQNQVEADEQERLEMLQKVEKKRIDFWTQYCDENPSELECRVYEI